MKTKTIFFMAFLAAIFGGCKEHAQPDDLKPGKEYNMTLKTKVPVYKDAANPQNPFDYAGAVHNEGLQELFNYTVASGDTTRIGKRKKLREFFKKRFDIEPTGVTNTVLEIDIKNDYRKVHKTLKMSALAHVYVEKMNQTIDGIKSLDEFDSFKKKFIHLERQIETSTLSRFERTCLLKTASVMRHSAFFWFNFANNNDKVEPMGLLRKLAGIITGIAADGTSALYYAFVSATFYKMLESSIEMSEMCGFYTGGFSYW